METIFTEGLYYNEEFKDKYFKYLRKINKENTINNTHQLFRTSKTLEESLEKDLFLFSVEEVINLIRKLNGKEQNSVSNRITMLSAYCAYCKINGVIENNIFDKYNPRDLIKESNISFKHKFITRKMVYEELLPKLNSYQDKAMVVLLFENVVGNIEELTSLKVRDINYVTKTLVIKRHDKLKYVTIKDSIVDILFKASQEKHITTLTQKKKYEHRLECSATEYLIRFNIKGSNPDGKLSNEHITNRFNKLVSYIKTYYRNDRLSRCCNADTLRYSGLFEKLLKTNLNPGLKDYEFIMGTYTANKATSIGTLMTKFAVVKCDEDFKRDYEEYYMRDGEIPVIANEEFVERKTETGLWGENFIYKDLATRFGKDSKGDYNVKKLRARVGYDLMLLDKYCLEIKTSEYGFPNSFHISITELKRANEEKDNYFIVLVEKYDENVESVKLIQNPIKRLGIDFNRLTAKYESTCDCCVISQENFHIRLNNESLKTISYIEFINLVNK